ncbi:MAG: spore coat protein [Oscillospiraceae bacterium]|jgi:spore coat protein CotF|nr:spore coat protein [Oscillospiraceae bacterium]
MNGSTQYQDKEMMTDVLSSQKFITSGYNTVANECACPNLKTDLLNILNEEHQIQHEVFCEMNKRGWYQTEPADQGKVNQVKQHYLGATF